MHGLEAWNEAVCEGAWGRWAARLAERVRQALDLEHWAAFDASFRRLCGIVADVAAGRRGAPPATVVALSGDVHHAYLVQVELGEPAQSRVFQAVCSPCRNPLDGRERRLIRAGWSRPLAVVGRLMARSAGVDPPPLRWRSVHRSPWFDNQVATLRFDARRASLRIERTRPGQAGLETVFSRELAG
jgi:hypothetical protein